MMTALVLVEPHDLKDASTCVRSVAKTLAALVGLVIADLVADGIVVTLPGVDFDLLEQTAGCLVVSDDPISAALTKAAGVARRERLLLLRPGFAPDTGFSDEIVSALESKPDEPRSVRIQPETLLQRLAPGLSPVAALILPRTMLPQELSAKATTLNRLADRLRAQTMRTRAVRF